jgi:hypothetical protein
MKPALTQHCPESPVEITPKSPKGDFTRLLILKIFAMKKLTLETFDK